MSWDAPCMSGYTQCFIKNLRPLKSRFCDTFDTFWLLSKTTLQNQILGSIEWTGNVKLPYYNCFAHCFTQKDMALQNYLLCFENFCFVSKTTIPNLRLWVQSKELFERSSDFDFLRLPSSSRISVTNSEIITDTSRFSWALSWMISNEYHKHDVFRGAFPFFGSTRSCCSDHVKIGQELRGVV